MFLSSGFYSSDCVLFEGRNYLLSDFYKCITVLFWNEWVSEKNINEQPYNLHEKGKCLGISNRINSRKQAIRHLKEVK